MSKISTISSVLEIPVTLRVNGEVIETTALIDSGVAGNFIDSAFSKTHRIPLVACESRLAVAALDGRPLGSGRIQFTTEDLSLCTGAFHTETIRLFVFQSPQTPIILGLPWLEKHNPTISWPDKQITHWSKGCRQHCLDLTLQRRGEVTAPRSTHRLPVEYHDLIEAFSKTKASQLPPHRSNDCAIELQPNSHPPRGRVFPLSQPESEAMKSYIEEELANGFIRPSTSPASAGFFFVKKKDGGLRPCIDYRSLNDLTVKFRYPLPLVPAALEQLRTANYFTKLDLRNAYNLIRIREGDEWKTAFSTTSGHYEYLVMPFRLVNSPSVFQAFVNDVFRDMLNRWVIMYIDDILIYSDSYEDHVKQVRSVLQRLLTHQLYAKIEKCEFHQTSVSFLGYVISSGGVAMEDKKVQAVIDWPQPVTLKELQRFLGFANFYRRFIRNFSTVATGFQPPLFPWSGEPSELPAVDSWLQRSEETWNEAHVHLQRAIRRTREQADRRRRANPNYRPGQWVWLSTRDLRLRLPCKKLSPRYVGPFKILREITPVSFRLALPSNYRISPTFHVSLLKPAGGSRGAEDQEEAEDPGAPPIIIDGEEVY